MENENMNTQGNPEVNNQPKKKGGTGCIIAVVIVVVLLLIAVPVLAILAGALAPAIIKYKNKSNQVNTYSTATTEYSYDDSTSDSIIGGDDSSSSSSDFSFDTTTEDISSSSSSSLFAGKTIEDMMGSDVQKMDSSNEYFTSISYYAIGNNIYYDYYFSDKLDDSQMEAVASANYDSTIETAKNTIENATNIRPDSITITYYKKDGTLVGTKTK